MANNPISNPKVFSQDLRQIELTDPVHKDTLNPLLEQLINNDAFLKDAVDGLTTKEELAKKQSELYGIAFRRLRTGQSVVIACKGDSMTYGHDTYSANKVAAPTDVLPDGSKHVQTRAPITYPSAMQDYLNEVYPGQVTVINQGYSGDWTQRTYERWTQPVGAHITTINLGINDSQGTWVPNYGDIVQYIEWYEKLIIREIGWGSAVIMLIPPKMQNAGNMNVDTFANALYALATKYGIPLIETEFFTANYGADINSDSIHFNSKGYQIYGARLAATFVGEGPAHPLAVTNGSRILTRKAMDGIVYQNGSFVNIAGSYTPAEVASGLGITLRFTSDGVAYYSFYAETEDTVIVPMFYTNYGGTTVPTANADRSQVEIALDFGIESPDNSFDYLIEATNRPYATLPEDHTSRAPSVLTTIADTPYFHNYLNKNVLDNGKFVAVRAVTKGWHTLRIKFKRGTVANAYSYIYGLEFLNQRSFELAKRQLQYPVENLLSTGSLRLLTHDVWAETPSDVLEMRFKAADLQTALNLTDWGNQYYKGPALKVTVTSYDHAVIEYMLMFYFGGTFNSAAGKIFGGELRRTNLKTSPADANIREISDITYDQATKEYVIKFKTLAADGVTPKAMNRQGNVVIQPL